jgi:hypothetical protein
VWRVGAALAVVGSIAACSGGSSDNAAKAPDRPAPLVLDQATARPGVQRDEPVIVAGEPVRLGVRFHGGTPPYHVAFVARPLARKLVLTPAEDAADGLEAAGSAPTDPNARSETYTIPVKVTDATGEQVASKVQLRLVGAGERERDAPGGAPWIDVTDVAGRRRYSHFANEQLSLRVHLGDPVDQPRLELRDAEGDAVFGMRLRTPLAMPFTMPLQLPRFVSAGDYRLAIGGTEVDLRIDGPSYSAMSALTIDGLLLWGGADLRADRGTRMIRGELVFVEARFGGFRGAVTARLKLRDSSGDTVAHADLGTTRPATRGATARAAAGGRWTVPGNLSAGRYTLEVEVREGDATSAMSREVTLE